MKELFESWRLRSSAYNRLQWAYIVVAVVLLFIGGLVSLIDNPVGIGIATFALYVGMIFVINFVANSVITALVGTTKPSRPTPRR